MRPDLAVYLGQTIWLLDQIDRLLDELPPGTLADVPGIPESNSPLAIARHASAVTRAYALGMGCGVEIRRNREEEFTAGLNQAGDVRDDLRSLRDELARAFERCDVDRLDRKMTPEPALYGLGELREMTPREAIIENIRHLGIHLGELRFTVSLRRPGD